jgi:DNA-binding NarL/FixJ family response regulator
LASDEASGSVLGFSEGVCGTLRRPCMKVLVASHQRLIGESLAALLESALGDEPREIALCDTDSVVESIRAAGADVVLLDMATDVPAAIASVRRLAKAFPDLHVVAVGGGSDEAVTYQAVRAGADGYISPDVSGEILARTLRGVMRGELGLPRVAALGVIRQWRNAATKDPRPIPAEMRAKLSQREREVFDLVLRGMRSRDIARQLFIAESTVYKHIQNILDKLHLQSRTHAIFSAQCDEQPLGPTEPVDECKDA